MRLGQKAADTVARWIGSWWFVLGQAGLLVIWFTINTLAATEAVKFDPPPFIAANLFMSAEAAFATPLLLMSQNRAAAMDREILHKDFLEDTETNRLVEKIADHLGVTR